MRTEALRRSAVAITADYRCAFDWLLQTVRRLNDDAADGGGARPAPDAPRIAAFLQGQFRADRLAPQLAAEVRNAPRMPNHESSGTSAQAMIVWAFWFLAANAARPVPNTLRHLAWSTLVLHQPPGAAASR